MNGFLGSMRLAVSPQYASSALSNFPHFKNLSHKASPEKGLDFLSFLPKLFEMRRKLGDFTEIFKAGFV